MQTTNNEETNTSTQTTYEMPQEDQFTIALKEKANKDMLWGGIWFVGGVILTIADIGFYFWGAIVFGGIQFIRGVISYTKLN